VFIPRFRPCIGRSVSSNPLGVIGVLAFVLSFLDFNAAAQVTPQNLVITEFMAANATGLQDMDGEYSDWIEIYNPHNVSVSLVA